MNFLILMLSLQRESQTQSAIVNGTIDVFYDAAVTTLITLSVRLAL